MGVIKDTDHLNELGWWDEAQVWTGESANDLLQRIHRFYASVAKDLP
jgi:broad specificity phosphatase PhoE